MPIMPPIIPEYQAIPFPAPLWLLQLLLVLGFYLHVLPMNIAFGSGLTAGLISLKNKNKDETSYEKRLVKSLAYGLPLYISFAITQGIVPLLFLQLIYGPLYYTSSMIMAWPWLIMLLILMTGYYMTYIYKMRHQKNPASASPWYLIGATLFFAFIGFMFSNNMTLMLTPDKWAGLLEANTHGWALNLTEPTLIPRYLHFVVSAFAMTGMLIGVYGLYYKTKEPDYSQWLIKKGSGIFLVLTLLQVGVGGWWLMTMPREMMQLYMGGNVFGTYAFIASMALMLIAILTAAMAWKDGSSKPFTLSFISTMILILTMIVMRHVLRHAMTIGFFDPSTLPVKIQWDLLIAFILSAVGIIIFLVWLSKLAWKGINSPIKETH